MAGDREKRMVLLEKAISQMDSGILQVEVYKGMPVKLRFVSHDVVLGGETVLNLDNVESFSPRKWWVKSP